MISVSRMIIKTILLSFITVVYGYNIDTDFPIIYSYKNALKNDNNYFGYTVHLYHEPIRNVSWLIVGAPRGNYSRSTKKKSNQPREPGVVYRCAIAGETCEEIKPKEIEDEKGYIAQLNLNVPIKKEHGWFGSAIAIDEPNGILTVCAPRTVVSIVYPFAKTRLNTMQGMCYSGDIFSNALSAEKDDLNKFHDFSTTYWYNPMYGFSVHYASMKQNESKELNGPRRIIGKPQHETLGTVNIMYSNKRISIELPLSDDLSHFGYSVESGYFFRRNELLYVSSAPGWHYVGQVAIMNPAGKSVIVEQLHGTEIGEFFGASLAVGDLDNDGLDDLLVGAPHWGQDNGKVYIYFGTEKEQFETVVFLQGTTEGGYFGYAIASGDLDADGFDDIIVGAPWEGSGVIYVYNGDLDVKYKKLQASERIEAVHLSLPNTSPTIERFGFSISKPIDVDRNGYPDIAVGAYKSQRAIVFRSKPVLKTKLLIRAIPNTLERDAEQFLIEICLRYEGYNVQKVQDTDSKVTVTVDEQYHRTKDSVLELRFSNLISYPCLEIQVNVSKNIRDFLEPINIFAKHEFVYNSTLNRFCKCCPTEKKYNRLNTAQILLPFNIDCGTDRVCNSNISVTAKFQGVRDNDTWVIGSEDIDLLISLKNHGEPSYLITVEFTFPENVLLRSILPSCREDSLKNNLIVICDVGNPLWREEAKHIKLELDMKHLTHSSLNDNKLNFYMTIKSRSTNQGTTNITKTLNLLSEVSLSLNGKASEGIYYLSSINDNASNIIFEHTYQMYKLGATPIEEAKLIIKVPTAVKDSEPLVHFYRPQVYVSGEVFQCLSDVRLDSELIEVQGEPSSDESEMQVLSANMYYNGSRMIRARDVIESSIELYDVKNSMKLNTVNDSSENDISYDKQSEYYDEGNIKTSQTVNDSLINNIFYMNCSTNDVNCTIITCDLNALKTLQDIGKVPIKFLLYINKLKDIFEKDTVILKFGTQASVEVIKPAVRLTVNGTRATMEIQTMFYNVPKTEEIQLWIILVSISIGLLLLLIFATILSTLGFFKRKGTQNVTNDEVNVS